ncbi:MAG TPA: hypothetical protein VMV10_13910 [Pirellulales bacterium]|nr:hypothetical protein [Pirellulales bacterium]
MELGTRGLDEQQALQEILGYLNFSSGAADSRFQRNVNALFALFEADPQAQDHAWSLLGQRLAARLKTLRESGLAAFEHAEQAEAVLGLVFERLLPDYQQRHRDLLYRQSAAELFRPFFVARACEAVLAQGAPWDETERIVSGALDQLDAFIGHRPVAVLRTPQRIEPYAGEWVRPIPLYLKGVGVGVGRYHDVIEQALAILDAADPDVLEAAYFDPELLDELALDPRAYDFDHPVNKRPNYQFGQWDPHHIDAQGRYRRFVLEEVSLDALVERTLAPCDLPPEEVLFEAGAVLAGVILMASGISGRGPETHDSGTTLATLVQRIAAFRDAFYVRLLGSLQGPHGERLRAEAAALRQPFGGARQHLNQRLARLRAIQLQHVHLAQLFARMGFAEASSRQAHIVPVASARMLCEINGRLTAGRHAIDRGQLAAAGRLLPEIKDLLDRAIDCGALVDPWNILGFQGQFSLFPAMENSVRDHRVDVLIQLIVQIFGLHSRLQAESAAHDNQELADAAAAGLKKLARWWDQFATLEVAGVVHVSGREAVDSADHVAEALRAWRQGGAASGDIAFWRRHVERFNSPKAYALVVEALLEQRDFVAARALLVQWLGQAEQAPLADGEYSFHDLAVRWVSALRAAAERPAEGMPAPDECWTLIAKFFDYLEANADEYWEVPRCDLAPGGSPQATAAPETHEEGEVDENLFSAAYDEVTYRDSTSDGHEADMLEGQGPASDFELDFEAQRLGRRLAFLATAARLWKIAAAFPRRLAPPGRDETLHGWFERAVDNRHGLFELLRNVHGFRLPQSWGAQDSLVEYDRRRLVKESLLGDIIDACVETSSAARWLLAAGEQLDGGCDLAEWEQQAIGVLRAMFRGDAATVRLLFPELRKMLEGEPILYIPLARRGAPGQIVGARTIQQLMLTLLRGLPRLGLLAETCQVIAAAQAMEQHRPAQEGAVTEFDHLFEVGYRALVRAIVAAAGAEPAPETSGDSDCTASGLAPDAELIDCLKALTESLLKRWLDHSRSLRLSVLEKVSDSDRWQSLVQFIERYGHDLFTPRFSNVGNLRGILHQGAAAWLEQLEQDDQGEPELRLLKELDREIPRAAAAEQLTIVIEAIVENYAEFKDFNSTTTQSDRGELMYVLLDFLRLKASYERVVWHIKPVVLTHEILVRRGRAAAAELWRRSVAERTSQVADWHLKRLAELTKQYGVRLPTVVDRLGERFVRTLDIDRVKALVRPAIEEARRGGPTPSFELLEQELTEFTDHPAGSGLDIPAWLSALEHEIELAGRCPGSSGPIEENPSPVPCTPLSWEEVQQQIRPEEL